jgi:hypothetical protein
MKKLIAALALFVGLNVNAGIISIETSDTNVDIGETVSVTLNATGFGDFDFFGFDFNFNTSVFSYDASTLMTDLDPLSIFEVNQVADGMAFSFTDVIIVSGDLMLASFDLIALSAGATAFSIGDALFGDFFAGTDLTVDTSAMQRVQVSTPATLGIFAIAAFAFAGFRRKA